MVAITPQMQVIGLEYSNSLEERIDGAISLAAANETNHIQITFELEDYQKPFLSVVLPKYQQAGYFVLPDQPTIDPRTGKEKIKVLFVW